MRGPSGSSFPPRSPILIGPDLPLLPFLFLFSSSSSSPKIAAAITAIMATAPITRHAFSLSVIVLCGFSSVKEALRCSVVRLAVINPISELRTSIV